MARIISLFLLVFVQNALFFWTSPANLYQESGRVREVVYLGEIFTGEGYEGQFYPQAEQTLYLLAGRQNILIPKETQVYWWPIDKQFKADWEMLDKALDGSLVINGTRFPMTSFALRYQGGYDAARTSVLVGTEAEKAYSDYKTALSAYTEALAQYEKEKTEFNNALAEWGRLVDEARKKGEPTDEIQVPKQPTPPTQPVTVITTPSRGISITLSSGKYHMVLEGPDGKEVPGSQRELVVFSARRSGIAYKILAASKYTIPEISTDPNDLIFVGNEKSIYIQPAKEEEFNRFYAAKLLNPQDRTVQKRNDQWTWLPTGAFTGSVLKTSGKTDIQKALYLVKQTSGSALGYSILPVSADNTKGGATFEAFKVDPERRMMVYIDQEEGSTRTIRMVDTLMAGYLLPAAIFPMFVGLIITQTAKRRKL